eukprot:TRINITY_DN49967_c0_g1_i1.p1 TRINITY_DN49967_c0_g1~~TRINITY_DN49967_c0_g1_i1.p1  ORF type:complete len:339 (+),score=61.13 TRINITY_DN49967_c0_g1_i1:84-1019(+)
MTQGHPAPSIGPYDTILAALGERSRSPPRRRGVGRRGSLYLLEGGHAGAGSGGQMAHDAGGPRGGDDDRGRPDPYLTQFRQAPLSRDTQRHRRHDQREPRGAREWRGGGWLVEQLRPQQREEARRVAAPAVVPAEVLSAATRVGTAPGGPGLSVLARPPGPAEQRRASPADPLLLGAEDHGASRPSTRATNRRASPSPVERAATPAAAAAQSGPGGQRCLAPVKIKRRITADTLFDLSYDDAMAQYPELRRRVNGLTEGQRNLWRMRWPERHHQLRELIDCWLPDIAPLERAKVKSLPYGDLFQQGVFLLR